MIGRCNFKMCSAASIESNQTEVISYNFITNVIFCLRDYFARILSGLSLNCD